MNQLQIKPLTDTWVAIPWETYLQHAVEPEYENAKGYYFRGCMRLEMLPVGFDHSTDHALLSLAISLYGILKGIPLRVADACSYRKTGLRECQPDLSVYAAENAQAVPKSLNIVNLDQYRSPDLVIEIAKTTLFDDLGIKRSLYEEIGVREYWVVDVEKSQILAYAMVNRGSHRIDASEVLPGLAIAVLESALTKAKDLDQSAVGAWLMQQFQ